MDSHAALALGGIAALSLVLSFFGATVGLVLGHFRLPLLIAYLGSPVAGASTNLAISGLGAIAGSLRHASQGRVSLPVVALMGIPSMIGAAVGVVLFIKINRFWSSLGLGTILVILGLHMARAKAVGRETLELTMPQGSRLLAEIAVGLFLGILSSVTGLMMSSLRVPMMIRLLKIDTKVAVGSNMVIGLLTAAIGALTSYATGGGFDWPTLAVVGPPTMLGSYLGALVTGHLKKGTIQRLLGCTIAVLGLVMAVEAFWRETRPRDLQRPPHNRVEVEELTDERDEIPEWP